MNMNAAQKLVAQFELEGDLIYCKPFGEGHINSTFVIGIKRDDSLTTRYILQKINTAIFKDYESLLSNISLVTDYLRAEIIKENGDPDRETMSLIPAKNGKNYIADDNGDIYRVYVFIEDATCYQSATPELFYRSAKAFGKFAKQLDAFDATQLVDTIDKFHHTANRYNNFEIALEHDAMDRAKNINSEIQFVKARKDFCSIILNEIESGAIPLRVCHNDTKLNNVMIDDATNEGLCVIDLDTVMKGSLLYDFGDSIRFGASSAAEDEENLDLVYCDLDKYELFVKGYLEECISILSPKEFELLAQGAILMTFECGMRFLTDYLDGDIYFKTHKPNHNLYRARNQFKLVSDMEAKLSEMIAINNRYK